MGIELTGINRIEIQARSYQQPGFVFSVPDHAVLQRTDCLPVDIVNNCFIYLLESNDAVVRVKWQCTRNNVPGS